MPVLEQDGWTYWAEHDRTLFRTNSKGKRVGPSFSAADIHYKQRPVVFGDVFVFKRKGRIWGADFKRNRAIPLVSWPLLMSKPTAAVLHGKLFVGDAGGFFHRELPGDSGGHRGGGLCMAMLSLDLAWLDRNDPNELPGILSRVVKCHCCP